VQEEKSHQYNFLKTARAPILTARLNHSISA